MQVLPQFTGFASTQVQILMQQARLTGRWAMECEWKSASTASVYLLYYYNSTNTDTCGAARQGALLYSACREVQVLSQHGRNDYACCRKIQDRLDPKYVLLKYV